ncbi:hypothetical protein DW669_07805 [Lachnospiraceae bacterium AM25-17]|nr:hypothetical protein DW669_07805 [Lachnospiraceae bacterium AM25-17]
MILAHMINTDEDALICDLAETYKIFDYRSLPCKTVATFSCGLGDNSRIKMKLADTKITTEEMLLSALVDNTKLLAWLNSQDGANGVNRPESLLAILTGQAEKNDNVMAFESGEDFKREWERRAGGA